MTPEAKVREVIDDKLAKAGWVVQDFKKANLGAAVGVAVREYPNDTGPADYVLFVESERFKYFSYEDLIARDKASLDIFWLKDESLDNLPPLEVQQQEIIEHLEAALSAFRDAAAGPAKTCSAKS